MDQFKKAINEIEFNQTKKEILDSMQITIQTCTLVAKVEIEYFKALVNEGFSVEQALYIVAKQGINIGRTEGGQE